MATNTLHKGDVSECLWIISLFFASFICTLTIKWLYLQTKLH
ncbi:cytochrome o ubiquinol oxidase subunit IV [Prevotella nigrescens ATCC 33563]|nr:cytochrome o ubiquinol oxidase subunit IV [Prevotella nigrescens ATCC 33563]